MILFTRPVAQNFRLLFARCVAGRPRGPAPSVVIRTRDATRTLAATTAEGVTLTHTAPAPQEPDDLAVLPASVLAEVEGGTDEPVILDRETKIRGTVGWHGGGEPQIRPVELILPGKQHDVPTPPELTAAPARLLAALHECARTTARESGRYALSRVQIQGKAGRVVGTDGKVALLCAGFRFPFTEDVLVPAVPVFGAKPLARITEVKLGRTATHLIVAVGPWSVWLPTDTRARYPDVAAVLPQHAPTAVEIDGSDAAELLPVLPGLPGNDHELRPIVLDADRVVRVSGPAGGGDTASAVGPIALGRSRVAGPAVRVVLDRRVLARALALGCRRLRLAPEKPVAAEGPDVTLLAAQLDPALAGEIGRAATPTNPPGPDPERSDAMKPHETNGHAANGRHDPPTETIDPLTAAEELRTTLGEALTKAGRLVTALKVGRKERKALAHVYAGLKQLNLEQP